ncbi:MAG TPA: tRNA (adenosine(37)-N6)-threonylcarbamoyltransferase complex dimerization subunit type 1 TsaB [Terracidiphilus sp.]|jgi:tRNA threonylcarbamoyladenosine biosynthesis protein TsaB
MAVLGIDTCGPAGTVALARLGGDGLQILGQTRLEGRTYSATLIAALGDLLKAHAVSLGSVGCLVVVSGPGSFTGVRVGLSAAKGLAEGAGMKVVAVSRLEILAQLAGVAGAALDAHRHEVFLRAQGRELLAGPAELAAFGAAPAGVAVCDEAAAELLRVAWPSTELVRVEPPDASDAIRLAVPRIEAGAFADVLLLDGHYVRRSDAEIFGDAANASGRG